MRSIFNWLIDHLTYTQIYIFVCLFFFLSVIPITYYWVSTHIKRVRMINEQLEEIKAEGVLKNLFFEFQEHRTLAQNYLMGNKENLNAMLALESQIQNNLKQTIKTYSTKYEDSTHPDHRQGINLSYVEENWDSLMQQLPLLTPQQSEIFHKKIVRSLIIQLGYLNAKLGISHFKDVGNYALIETIFLRLPYLQENLSELISLAKQDWDKPKPTLSERLLVVIGLIDSDLSYLEYGTQLDSTPSIDSEESQILKLLSQYRISIEKLMGSVNQHFSNKEKSSIPLSQFIAEGENAIKHGYELWDWGLKELRETFEAEKAQANYLIWGVPLTNITLKTLAFLLGLALILIGSSRFSKLTAATESFTNGNLSIRVPDTHKDEIGRQAQAFNRMAQKLEELINHLYELLGATTALANGDLTTRIPIHRPDTEFNQVAQSFNKMAETFETIIGRLQQIGFMITTSASEIASASKEQETIVVEQEATTREISIAANEISSTAKEFASTMNEVNLVAEQTSNLALKGKDSLNNMETIMRQMVDASSSIATKLAVLNEKANNITGVITTITKVADQTNLLSLNASIEAEKAGEYGRSFSVIAREIRRLADQTAIATLDIEKIVNEMMTAVSSSVMGVDDFTQEIRNGVEQVRTVSEQLTIIIEQVQAFTARFELVNQGMQAQSTGAGQINEAIAQLSKTAQQTSQAIHQFYKTIQELNNVANELRILSPFIKSTPKEESPPITKIERQIRSLEPTPTESSRQFDKTLSNLNTAANKLKNLNIQLRPPPIEKQNPEE